MAVAVAHILEGRQRLGSDLLSSSLRTESVVETNSSPSSNSSDNDVTWRYMCEDREGSPPLDHAHTPVSPPTSPKSIGCGVSKDSVTGEDKGDGEPVYKATTAPLKAARSCCRWTKKRFWPWNRRTSNKKVGSGQEQDECGNGRDTGPGKPMLWMFTKQQWFLLLVLCTATLTSSFAVCLFPPFFPKVAQEKGFSSSIFGIIIGTNCFMAFLVTPFIGKKINSIGVKFAFTAGLFSSGGCCILSGFLEWFPPGPLFVVIAIMIRAVHATANAFISTATFAYIGGEFPDSMAKVFAWTRTTMNVAQMFGPVLGGALLEVGGFKMPFLVMGSIQMSMTLLSAYLPPDSYETDSKSKNETDFVMWKVFLIRGIWVSFITFIFSTMSNGFLSITLEPDVLRTFDLGPLYVGLLFGLKDGANSIAAPFWGWVCDRYHRVKIFIFFSSCLACTSFILLGPFPGLPINRTLGIVILALVLNGIGIGGQQVSGVVDAMREVVDAGFPDTAGTHGFVAGLWASLSGIGRFTSRAGSGFLVDTIGFRDTSCIVVILHGFVVVMTLVYLIICGDRKYKHLEDSTAADNGYRTGDGEARIGIFTNTPSEPVTTKAVNINSYRQDIEDSIFCGSAPILASTRYVRASLSVTSQSLEIV